MKQPAELVVRLLQVALLGLTVYDAWALWGELATQWRVAVVLLFGAFVVLWLLRRPLTGWPSLVLGALIVPLFALLGFDALAAPLVGHPDAGPSIAIGVVVLVIAYALYFTPPWSHVRIRPRWRWVSGVGLALILVIVPPLGYWTYGQLTGGPEDAPPKFVSSLDVIVVGEGLTPALRDPLQRTPGKVVGSFHPTSAGYQRLADVIAAQLRASPTQAPG